MTPSRRRVAITGLGLVTPVGNDVPDDVERAARRPQRGRTDQPVRRDRLPDAHRRRGEGLRSRARDRRPQAPQVREPLAPVRARRRRAGDARRRHPSRRGRCGTLGLRRRHRHDGRHLRRSRGRSAPCGAGRRARRRPSRAQARVRGTIRWCSAAASRRRALRCCCAASASAAMRRRCTPPARPAARRVGTAMKLIRRGTADRVLAGGFDSMINPVGLGGFCLLSAVSPDNETPRAREPPVRRDAQRLRARAKAPASSCSRNGSRRARRGANIYAELAGDGNSLSSYRITDSHPSATDRSRRCARRSPMPARGRTTSTT